MTTSPSEHDGHRISLGRELRARIEHSLHTRTAPVGTATGKIEEVVKSEGQKLWHHRSACCSSAERRSRWRWRSAWAS